MNASTDGITVEPPFPLWDHILYSVTSLSILSITNRVRETSADESTILKYILIINGVIYCFTNHLFNHEARTDCSGIGSRSAQCAQAPPEPCALICPLGTPGTRRQIDGHNSQAHFVVLTLSTEVDGSPCHSSHGHHYWSPRFVLRPAHH